MNKYITVLDYEDGKVYQYENLEHLEHGWNQDEVEDGEILEKLSGDEYKIKIKDNEYVVKILHTDSNVMEFVLNNEFHSVRYVDSQTSEMNFIVDGSSMSVNMNSHLDDIVYKNSGGSDSSAGQSTLRSQIPGKVVSIDVEDGAEVKKGDTVCTLESMKMQVAVKAQKDGIVKGIKIKEGNSVNKNDVIADIE